MKDYLRIISKILFICEGEKTEKKFCNLIIDKYFLKRQKQKEYVAYGTNIYGLYEELSKDNGLNIIELVKERALKKGDMYNYSKLSKGGYAEIYLIFDFDPHAPEYSQEKLEEMVKFFDNETENGKLYINYPMMESFKHFTSLPDFNYNSYCVKLNDCVKYKEYVSSISVINHFGSIQEKDLRIIVNQNLDKYSYIYGTNLNNYKLYLENFSQIKLLKLQNNNIESNNELFVLNTSVFWGLDYFGENFYNDYVRN